MNKEAEKWWKENKSELFSPDKMDFDKIWKAATEKERRVMNAKSRNRNTTTASDVEQAVGSGSMAQEENQRHDSPCCICIHSTRLRLADSDGISGKAVLDGLVY